MGLFSKPNPNPTPVILPEGSNMRWRLDALEDKIDNQKKIIKQEVLATLLTQHKDDTKQPKIDTFDWERGVFFAEVERELLELNDYCNNNFNELEKLIEESSQHSTVPGFITQQLDKLDKNSLFLYRQQEDMRKAFVKWFGKLLASGLKGEEYKEASRDYQQLKEG